MPFPERDDPWAVAIDAKLLPQVVENAIAIIGRDQEAAIAYAQGDLDLPLFEEVHRARRTDIRFPFIAVGGGDSTMTPLEEGGAVRGTHEVVIEIADNDPDPDVLALRIQAYYNAVIYMIHAAQPQDWTYGTNATDAIWGDIRARLWDIRAASRESGYSGYVMAAEFSVPVQLVEG